MNSTKEGRETLPMMTDPTHIKKERRQIGVQ
jgi:hypothetical protein